MGEAVTARLLRQGGRNQRTRGLLILELGPRAATSTEAGKGVEREGPSLCLRHGEKGVAENLPKRIVPFLLDSPERGQKKCSALVHGTGRGRNLVGGITS